MVIDVEEKDKKGLTQSKNTETSQGEQLLVCLLGMWTDDCLFQKFVNIEKRLGMGGGWGIH